MEHRFTLLVLFGATALASACRAPCSLDDFVPAAATSSATQCGRVLVNGDSTTGVTCALDAQAAGTAFQLRLDRQGIDSAVADVFVRTPQGESLLFRFDSFGDGTVDRSSCTGFSRDDASDLHATGPDLKCDGATASVRVCD